MNRLVIHKYLFLTVLVLVVTQQIYFPQELKYFHLAMLLVYMAFSDMIDYEKRDKSLDVIFLSSVLLCSAVSVAEHFLEVDISRFYQVFLAVGGYASIRFLLRLKSRIRTGDKTYIAEKHQILFSRSTNFIEWILIGAAATTFLAIVYIFSGIFTN